MILILPYPDSRLLPNRRGQNRKGHWAAHGEVTAIARNAAKMIGLDVKNTYQAWRPGRYLQPLSRCRLSITWYPKNLQVADYDSMLIACKPFIDGLRDAGLLVNDSPRQIKGVTLSYGAPDKENPRTEIEITEAR